MSEYGDSDEVVPVLLTQVKQEPEDDYIVETVYGEVDGSFSEVENSFGEVDNSFDEADSFSQLSQTFNVHEPDYIITTQEEDDEEFYYIEQPSNNNVPRKRKRSRKESTSKRRRRCGECGPCQIKENCGKCIQCVRRSILKQSCIYRKCVYLRKPKKSASVSKPNHLNENAYQYLYPINDDVLMPDDTDMLERPQVLLSPEDRTSEHLPLSPTPPPTEPLSPDPVVEQMDQTDPMDQMDLQQPVEDQPDQQLPEDEREQLQSDSPEESTEESGETGACSQEFFQHRILESDDDDDNLGTNTGTAAEYGEQRVPSSESSDQKHFQHELLRQKILERRKASADMLHVPEMSGSSVVPEHCPSRMGEHIPSENTVPPMSSAGSRTAITSLERQFSGEDRDQRLPNRPILQQMAPTASHLVQRLLADSNSGQRFPSDTYPEQRFPPIANLESKCLPNGNPEQRFSEGTKAESRFHAGANLGHRYSQDSSYGNRVPTPGISGDGFPPRGSLVHWYPWRVNMEQRFPSASNLGPRFPPDSCLYPRFPTAAHFEHHFPPGAPFNQRLPMNESAEQKPSPGNKPDGGSPKSVPSRRTDGVQDTNSGMALPDKDNLEKRVSVETGTGHRYPPKSDSRSDVSSRENIDSNFPGSNMEPRFSHRTNMEQCVPPGPSFERGYLPGESFRHEHQSWNSEQGMPPRFNQNIHPMDRSKRDLYDRWHRQRTSHQEVMAYSRQSIGDPPEGKSQNGPKSRKRKLQETKERERGENPYARMSVVDSLFRPGHPYYPMPPGLQQSFRMSGHPHIPGLDDRNFNPGMSYSPYHPAVPGGPRPESPRAASTVSEQYPPNFEQRIVSPGMSHPSYHPALPRHESPRAASTVSEPYPPKFDRRNLSPGMSRPPNYPAVPRPESPRAASTVSEPYPPKFDRRNLSPGMSRPPNFPAVARPESPHAASTVSEPYPVKFDRRNLSPGMSRPPTYPAVPRPESPHAPSTIPEPCPPKFDHKNISPGMSRPPYYPLPRHESPRAASTVSEPYPPKLDSFRMRHPSHAPRMYSPWLPHGIPFDSQFPSYGPPGPMGYPNFQFRPGMMLPPPHMMPPYFPRFPHPPPTQYMASSQNNGSDQESGHHSGQHNRHPYYAVAPKPPNTSPLDFSANELTQEKAHENSQLRRYLDDVYRHSSGSCRQPPRPSSVPGGIEGKSTCRFRSDLSDYEQEMISIDDFHVSAYIRADGTNSVEIEIDEASLLGSRSISPANSDLTSVSRSGQCTRSVSVLKTSAVTNNKFNRQYQEILFQGEKIVIGLKSAVEGSVVMKQDLGEEGILQMEIPGHKFTVENVLLQTDLVSLSSNKEELLEFVKCVRKEVVDGEKEQNFHHW